MQLSKAKQIELAAFVHFTRDAAAIAKALDVRPRTVQRLIHDDRFHAELDRWGYEDERNFRTQQARDRRQNPDYEKVKRLWYEMSDIPEHRREREIAKQVDTDYHTLRVWIRDFKGDADNAPKGDIED